MTLAAVPCLAQGSDLLAILEAELKRNFDALQQKGDPKPYYLSYTVTERDIWVLDASYGSMRASQRQRQRILDVSLRVGDPQLDNYHRVRGGNARFTSGSLIALEDEPKAIVRILWRDTDRAYRGASQRLNLIKSNTEMQVAERDPSGDFSEESPEVDVQPVASAPFTPAQWEPKLKRWSAAFQGHEGILTSNVALVLTVDHRYFVDSKGSRIRHGRAFARVEVNAQSKASDGMNLGLSRSVEAETPAKLPADAAVDKTIATLIRDMEGLLQAPLAEPFVGPAILSGRAAAVFFHEIFGHRMEGHRQKDEREGQTFTSQVGQGVLAPFLSVYADPTQREVAGQDLMGWYAYDDEGVKARRVPLVEGGVLRNFMMSRSPVAGFPRSNGHGRKAPGNEVVSRQSNLLVEAARTVPEAALREALREEIRKQKKPYGLYFEDVSGGLTTTGRDGLQAFTVTPLVVYRVYADGRPDQLVRGVDIVGTPLTSFAKILAASDRPEVFNGFCGAESGSIPVAAVSPSLLVSEIETQRRGKAEDRPPLLPFPRATGGAQ
ncbi:MAG: metallopeptidase TldD-related protein [Bryobacterales bacterium]|nr:metallopeptidase TldD-related protein [Bryobacterales bacterium]